VVILVSWKRVLVVLGIKLDLCALFLYKNTFLQLVIVVSF